MCFDMASCTAWIKVPFAQTLDLIPTHYHTDVRMGKRAPELRTSVSGARQG